jgi:hypothetical protein
MVYFLVFSAVCLLLAALPASAWARASTVGVVAGLYLLCFLLARWSRVAAWEAKVVVDYEQIDMGFFGDDGHYFIPIYQGEGTWQWLLGLPVVALLAFRLVRRERNAPVRRRLKWLFFFYGVAVMYGGHNQWFPGPIAKPTFGNPELTMPPPPAAPLQHDVSYENL